MGSIRQIGGIRIYLGTTIFGVLYPVIMNSIFMSTTMGIALYWYSQQMGIPLHRTLTSLLALIASAWLFSFLLFRPFGDLKRARALRQLAANIMIDGRRLILPVEAVERWVATTGTWESMMLYEKNVLIYRAEVRVSEPLGRTRVVDVDRGEWTGYAGGIGVGWFVAKAYVVEEGEYRGVVIIPLPRPRGSGRAEFPEIGAYVEFEDCVARGYVPPHPRARSVKVRVLDPLGKVGAESGYFYRGDPGYFQVEYVSCTDVVVLDFIDNLAPSLFQGILGRSGAAMRVVDGMTAEVVYDIPWAPDIKYSATVRGTRLDVPVRWDDWAVVKRKRR